MRIDSNQPLTNQVADDRASSNAGKAGGAPSSNAWSAAESSFSATAAGMANLTARALETPAVRQDRVDALRQAISSGSYEIDPKQIADAMLSEAAQ